MIMYYMDFGLPRSPSMGQMDVWKARYATNNQSLFPLWSRDDPNSWQGAPIFEVYMSWFCPSGRISDVFIDLLWRWECTVDMFQVWGWSPKKPGILSLLSIGWLVLCTVQPHFVGLWPAIGQNSFCLWQCDHGSPCPHYRSVVFHLLGDFLPFIPLVKGITQWCIIAINMDKTKCTGYCTITRIVWPIHLLVYVRWPVDTGFKSVSLNVTAT